MPEEDIRTRKIKLRKKMNAILQDITKDDITRQSKAVCQKVLEHPAYLQAKSVSIYLSFEKEIQTDVLVEDIFFRNKKCYIPRFRKGSSEMEMVLLESEDQFLSLPTNRWGIRQPLDEETCRSVFEEGSLDLVIMPGLAFTHDGRRLGRGKGYYDGFLRRCSTSFIQPPITLALAFQQQVVPDLPVSSRDICMDNVLVADD